MYNKILLDLDEVLADFLVAFGEANGQDLTGTDAWDLCKIMGISKERFMESLNSLGHNFWANLPKLEKADELVSALENYKLPIYIVSTPTWNPGSWSGKKEWINKNYPQFEDKLVLTKHKHLLADKGTVLIDDAPHNVESFTEHGGSAIAYPRLWNSASEYVGNEVRYVISSLDNVQI